SGRSNLRKYRNFYYCGQLKYHDPRSKDLHDGIEDDWQVRKYILEGSLAKLKSEMLESQSTLYAQSLCDILIPDALDSNEEIDWVIGRGHRLSPKDHWDNNGVLEDLVTWSRNGKHTLLWIGGASGNQDSWVTEFSVDMVKALQPDAYPLIRL